MATTHAWHGLVLDMRDEMHDLASINHLDAARQAYLALWATFVALPLVFGLDKFATLLSDDWATYLPSWANDVIPGSAADAMMWVGAVEIILALAVLLAPRIGGDLLAAWMLLVAIALFTIGGMHELGIAALAVGACALAMARLSRSWHHSEA